MNQKTVITGGAGFIGSALTRAVLASGAPRVTVLDNFSSGHASNLAGLESSVELVEGDIRDAATVARVIEGAGTVYHLAAIPSVPRSITEPVPSHEVNIDGTFQVLHASQRAGVRRVIFAASSAAYGDTAELPKSEVMLPNPKSPYAAQKVMGEYYGRVFHACYGLEVVSLRFFNVYGPRQDPSSPYSGVLSIFMKCLLERRSPTIHGDGEQTRDFTFVSDVTALCLKAAAMPGIGGRMYNAGNGSRTSLNEVWRTLNAIEGVAIPAIYGPLREGDVRDSQADTARAIRDLGHQPRYSLEQGLRETLDWYRSQP